MRLDREVSVAEVLAALRAEAATAWGEGRLDALQGQLEITAAALAQLSHHRLDPTDQEPDFVDYR